jgi:diadenosine tetraphosphatase ApaH/serine/threonine PP2A family protein phosphatase
VLLVHGSPRKINEYLFEDRPLSSFQRLAASSNADVIVFGHTHKPSVKEVDGVMFLNVGSVGKPKDGDWRACYAVLETGATPTATCQRVTYDVKKAADAIRATEPPHEFAADIETGGAPRSALDGIIISGVDRRRKVMSELPVACTLGPAALKARREGLLADLLLRADEHEELADGHRLHFAAADDILGLIASAIDAERQCCRFLRFRVTVEPDEGPILLELTGPEGTRDFLTALVAS